MFGGKSSKSKTANSRRTLEVIVVEARGILPCDKKGTSDANVIVKLKDWNTGTDIKKESFVTKTKSSTLNPVWSEAFTFGKNDFF